MKKILLVATTGAIIATTAGAAVYHCVNLSTTSSTCTVSNVYNRLEWNGTCTTNGKTASITGLSVCSNSKSPLYASFTSNITSLASASSDETEVGCWCQIIIPFLSNFVSAGIFTTIEANGQTMLAYDNCAKNCSYECAKYITIDSNFRKNILKPLS